MRKVIYVVDGNNQYDNYADALANGYNQYKDEIILKEIYKEETEADIQARFDRIEKRNVFLKSKLA